MGQDPPVFEAADDKAEADAAAGRLTPNAKVIEWLRSLGTSKPVPMPYSWRRL